MKFEEFLLTEQLKGVGIVVSENYKGEHSAPTKDDAPLHDLISGGTYPDDVYTHPRYYVVMETDAECLSIANRMKGKPDGKVRIYRSVPIGDKKATEKELAQQEKNKAAYQRRNTIPSDYRGKKDDYYDFVSDKIDQLTKDLESMGDDEKLTINAGDWVSLSKKYATEHGKDNLNNKYKILSKSVSAKEVHTDGNSLSEWGYNP